MHRFLVPLKSRLKSLIEFLPAGRDIYLAMARNRIGITYRGLFESSQSARAAVPASKANFYDIINSAKAKQETREKQQLDTWFRMEDYALLFWLSRILDESTAILELGGSAGHFFYTIQHHGICGSGIRWTIAELPEAVKLGTSVARERGEQRLTFLDSGHLSVAEPSDVFMTAGTLQYMEAPLWTILPTLAKLPPHVLVHNLPVHKCPSTRPGAIGHSSGFPYARSPTESIRRPDWSNRWQNWDIARSTLGRVQGPSRFPSTARLKSKGTWGSISATDHSSLDFRAALRRTSTASEERAAAVAVVAAMLRMSLPWGSVCHGKGASLGMDMALVDTPPLLRRARWPRTVHRNASGSLAGWM